MFHGKGKDGGLVLVRLEIGVGVAVLREHGAAARTRRLSHCAGSHTSLPPPEVASTRACSAFFLFRVPTLSLAGRFRARRFRARTRTHAPAHTHAQERPTTNDATCGPPAWLTGTLHEGGTRGVRSPLRRAPLLAIPIATPLQGGRPERPGPFCFLNH